MLADPATNLCYLSMFYTAWKMRLSAADWVYVWFGGSFNPMPPPRLYPYIVRCGTKSPCPYVHPTSNLWLYAVLNKVYTGDRPKWFLSSKLSDLSHRFCCGFREKKTSKVSVLYVNYFHCQYTRINIRLLYNSHNRTRASVLLITIIIHAKTSDVMCQMGPESSYCYKI